MIPHHTFRDRKLGQGESTPVDGEYLTGTGTGTSEWLPPFDRQHDHSNALDGITLAIAGGLNVSSIITPAQLTADTNDWYTNGHDTAFLWRLSADSTIRTITGFTAPAVDGAVHVVEVTTGTILLAHDSASSVAANRIYCPGSINRTIPAGTSVVIVYDGTSNRWIVQGLPYLEGEWTPVATFTTPGTSSFTPTTQVGRYTRIGNRVYETFQYIASTYSVGTASGALIITGRSWTPKNVTGLIGVGACVIGGYTKANYTQITPWAYPNDTNIYFFAGGSGQAVANLEVADMPGGVALRVLGSTQYEV